MFRAVIFALITALPFLAAANTDTDKSCDKNSTMVSFRADKTAEHDYSAQFCKGRWRLDIQGGQYLYIDDKEGSPTYGQPCVRNTTTNQTMCGEQINKSNEVDTKAVKLGVKDSRFEYKKDTKELFLIPLDKDGNPDNSKPEFKISGDTDKADPNIKKEDKEASLTITQLKPTGNGPSDKSGTLELKHKIGDGDGDCNDSALSGTKGGQVEYKTGTQCQKEDLFGHDYVLNEKEFKDYADPAGGGTSPSSSSPTPGSGSSPATPFFAR